MCIRDRASTVPTTMVITGMQVEIMPMPMPEMMTVAGPVFALWAILRQG